MTFFVTFESARGEIVTVCVDSAMWEQSGWRMLFAPQLAGLDQSPIALPSNASILLAVTGLFKQRRRIDAMRSWLYAKKKRQLNLSRIF